MMPVLIGTAYGKLRICSLNGPEPMVVLRFLDHEASFHLKCICKTRIRGLEPGAASNLARLRTWRGLAPGAASNLARPRRPRDGLPCQVLQDRAASGPGRRPWGGLPDPLIALGCWSPEARFCWPCQAKTELSCLGVPAGGLRPFRRRV